MRIAPRFARAHTGLGLLFARQGKLSEASDHFRRALEAAAGDAQAHFYLGLILKKRGQWGEAADHFRQAVQVDPNSEQAQYQWGLALAEEGKLSEATDHLRAALRIDPQSAEAHRSLAEVLMREGRSDEAEEQFQEDPKIATLIRSERGVRRISRLFLIRSAIRGLKEERSAIDGAQLGRRMAPSRVEPRPHLPRREQPWRGCGARGAGSPDSRIPALGSMRFYGVSARHFSIAGSV